MDHISITEKARWVSDLIFRELKRFEEDTKTKTDEVRISRIDGQITSVNLGIYRSTENES
jgi:hypothetical protein